MTAIDVSPSNGNYSSVNGVLFTKNMTSLIRCPGAKSGFFTLPGGVTRIADYAFNGCGAITGVTFPTGLTEIGASAFLNCGSLTNVTIPATVRTMGGSAFRSCGQLVSACFLGEAPTMGSNVFAATSPGFKIYYFNGKFGFTTPSWQGYPSVNMGAVSSVAPWLLANGQAYNASLKSDENSDGVSLLMAYALNLDPNKNLSGSMPVPVVVGNELRLTYYAGSAGVSYSVQRSGNLTGWTTTGVVVSAPDSNGFRTASVEMTEPGCMLRIVARY